MDINHTGCSVYTSHSQLVFTAPKVDRLFRIPTVVGHDQPIIINQEQRETHKVNKITSASADITTWHQRFSHLNIRSLLEVNRKGMVQGMNINGSLKMDTCHSCTQGKQTRLPFYPIKEIITSEPFELLYMDLCGPFPIQSLGGSKYMFMIVDDFTRMIFLRFLKTKDQAASTFEIFLNIQQNKYGYQVKAVRSDNGKEFDNKIFDNLLNKFGIEHQWTVVYSPQQNGVAERSNRKILDKLQTLLLDARLGQQLWAEAAATVAYTSNRSPMRRFSYQTPYERLTGEKPDVSNFQIFGSLAFTWIPKLYRNKLNPRSQPVIFIGYPAQSAGWKFLNPKTQQILIARDVKFDESKIGAEFLKISTMDEQLPDIAYIPMNTIKLPIVTTVTTDQPQSQILQGCRRYPLRNRVPVQPYQAQDWRQHRRRQDKKCRDEEDIATQPIPQWDHVGLTTDDEKAEPFTYQQAIEADDAQHWKKAMDDEIQLHIKRGTWELISKPPMARVIGCKWIYKRKTDPAGHIIKYKARLVAQGFKQIKGIDYEESYSPVVRLTTIRVILALAAIFRLQVKHYDVRSAYTHASLHETVYIKQPKNIQPTIRLIKYAFYIKQFMVYPKPVVLGMKS
uniref:Integrase catalytic domain-containing protein n=1 Tax=Strigamia maritima TaxID=126957 RepID=T1IMU7_STRMM